MSAYIGWPEIVAAQTRSRQFPALPEIHKDEQAEGTTMRTPAAVRSLLVLVVLLGFSHGAFAQIGIGISANFGPPVLPVYEQPICPADGYIWTPGYWAFYDGGYYWVPGTWVQAPQVGLLWTPGYWAWGDNAFMFHEGYWGPEVGYYGGIDYGYGYGGVGYEGGRWEGGHFAYNTSVNRVDTTIIHNTYNAPVVNASGNRVSYNGGTGGVEARPTLQQESYANESHVGPVAAQTRQVQEARNNPDLRASANQGKPPIAATGKPGNFEVGFVAPRQAAGEYAAPPANPARGGEARPANEASELQEHRFAPPNTGDPATDKIYQQQQDELAVKQTQDHQKLQQQQEEEHQQAIQENYNDSQKQQMEQRHAQQTQQLEQQHATEQKQMEQHQTTPKNGQKPN
jgi:hypothetical protein